MNGAPKIDEVDIRQTMVQLAQNDLAIIEEEARSIPRKMTMNPVLRLFKLFASRHLRWHRHFHIIATWQRGASVSFATCRECLMRTRMF